MRCLCLAVVTILFPLVFIVATSGVVDPVEFFKRGEALQNAGDGEGAIRAYEQALREMEGKVGFEEMEIYTLSNLGSVCTDIGEQDLAIKVLQAGLEKGERRKGVSKSILAWMWNLLGLAHYRKLEFRQALEAYEKSMTLDETVNGWAPVYNCAVLLKKLGHTEKAIEFYKKVIAHKDDSSQAKLNLAAAYHEYFLLDEAVEVYKSVLQAEPRGSSLRMMALSNSGLAYLEIGDAERAIEHFKQILEERSPDDTRLLLETYSNMINVQRIACDWENLEQRSLFLVDNVKVLQLEKGELPSLLPFDALLYRVPPEFRKQLAESHSHLTLGQPKRNPQFHSASSKARVGYMSFDFSEHPTSHLIEDLFSFHHWNGVIDSFTVGYGKNDFSSIRKRLETCGQPFYNAISLADEELVRLVRDELQIEVLVDLQGHTRGARLGVLAQRPAPIIVNYLVFPGTSGTLYTDYVLGDRFVSPLAESASLFSEKVVILPHSYQVNSYLNYEEGIRACVPWVAKDWDALRLARASFVFANFNKNDKLEPLAFDAWMQILHRVPGSVLWLLEASRRSSPEQMKRNLLREAAARGISASRIVFASRVPKPCHIARHVRAGLFLDTFLYGAHSTATDALKGGLPVLTLKGDSFASRVGVSLLANIGLPSLVTYSVQEFVDVAVRIARSPILAAALRRKLTSPLVRKSPLFDTRLLSKHLEQAFQSMITVQNLSHSPRHLIVINS